MNLGGIMYFSHRKAKIASVFICGLIICACSLSPERAAVWDDDLLCKIRSNPSEAYIAWSSDNFQVLDQELERRGIEDCNMGLIRHKCKSYGFAAGTDNFAQCVMLIDQARTARTIQERQQAQQNLTNWYGLMLQQQSIQQMNQPTPTFTNCRQVGNSFNCVSQ